MALLYPLFGHTVQEVRKNISLIFNEPFRNIIKEKGLEIDFVAKEVEKFYFHEEENLDEYVLVSRNISNNRIII